jgi:hypothetical protein
MNSFVLAIISGMLLACGQFFMKKVAVSAPSTTALFTLAHALLTSPYLYLFLSFNVAATVTYLVGLRTVSMTNMFAIVFVSMGATVLLLDILVNRVTLSVLNLLGIGLGILSVLLIATRHGN